ncbi:MAG: DUF3592 domain-containing protein [Gemmatimonadales bacterium]
MKRLIIGLLFILIGGGVISWGSRATTKVATSKSWPTVRGTVLSSSVVVEGRRYEADVHYRFIMNGERYESNVLVLGAPKSFADRSLAEKALAVYPKGSEVTVYYEPGNPARSTLEHGLATQNLGVTTLTGGVFLLLGLLLSISGALGWARSELVGR